MDYDQLTGLGGLLDTVRNIVLVTEHYGRFNQGKSRSLPPLP